MKRRGMIRGLAIALGLLAIACVAVAVLLPSLYQHRVLDAVPTPTADAGGSTGMEVAKQPSRLRPELAKSGWVFVGLEPGAWWFTVSPPCYHALSSADPGGYDGPRAFDMIMRQHPDLPGLLRDMDVDVERDLVEIGGFECGSKFCVYSAMVLRQPERLRLALEALTRAPGVTSGTVELVEPGHFVATYSAVRAVKMHLRLVELDWSGRDAKRVDGWTRDAMRATHLVLAYFDDASPEGWDQLSQAARRFDEVEALVPDTRQRCIAGVLKSLKDVPVPGITMARARVMIVAPPVSVDDWLAPALGFSTSPMVAARIVLSPPLRRKTLMGWQKKAGKWIDESGREWLPLIAGPVSDDDWRILRAIVGAALEVRLEGEELVVSLGTRNLDVGEAEQILRLLRHRK